MGKDSKKTEILCAGEVLFDFISVDRGKGIGESLNFKKRMGGSPFNVCCGLSALGESCSFFTQLGDDSFGKAIYEYLGTRDIDTQYAFVKKGAKTSLAFAGVDESGKADYEFYRENTADVSIKEQAAEQVVFDNISIFHFGSLAIVDEPGAKTYLKLFEKAKTKYVLTAFDPNIRPFCINDKEKYITLAMQIIQRVDVLKCSDEDLYYITGESKPEKALKLLPQNPKRMDFVTLGKEGCLIHHDDAYKYITGYKVDVSDTVGCGDSFMSGILKVINNSFLSDETDRIVLMEEAANFAVACAAIVASREGAADAMPTEKEVYQFIADRAD
ncbi:MAG: carbohydrate kinase [Thermotogota bacterium]|nr:carbohydrate kinase [Thermotogota bacterium]